MAKKLLLILFFLNILILRALSQNTDDDPRLREIVLEYGQAAVSMPLPGIGALSKISRMVSVDIVKDKSVRIIISPLTVDWFIGQKFNYKILDRPDSKGITMAASVCKAMEWDSYPAYSQYDSIMQGFMENYPDLCRVDTIGYSNYGKLVLALKVSDNAAVDEDEPEVFYSSTIHGDETGGFVLMLHLADYLLKNYNSSPEVKELVDNLEIWINPLANPDGTYKTGNTISSPVRFNANGYDLNRNFPDPETPNTVKQRETLDMIAFMRKHRFVISANFHAGSEVVNYPWDRWPRLHADNDWFYSVSRRYADTAHANSFPGYLTDEDDGITNGYAWYQINGGRQDFVTYELQGREVTIELDQDKETPAANLLSLWEYNYPSLLEYLENALYGIHGSVYDAVTGESVPARIEIKDHDKDSSQVDSDTLSGSFVRLIAPGTWNILFTADGYIDKTVDNVNVTDGQRTDLEVAMVHFTNPVDTVKTPVIRIYPDPATDYIKVLLPERQTGKVNVAIFNSVGMKVIDYNTDTFDDIPLYITVTSLGSGVYSIVITNTATGISDKSRFIITH